MRIIQQLHPRVGVRGGEFRDNGAGPVRRAPVDHQHLHAPGRIVLCQHGSQAAGDGVLLVPGRDDHAHQATGDRRQATGACVVMTAVATMMRLMPDG